MASMCEQYNYQGDDSLQNERGMDVVGQLMGRKWKRCRGKVSILDQLSPDASSGEDNGQRIGAVTRRCNEEMNGALITDACCTMQATNVATVLCLQSPYIRLETKNHGNNGGSCG